MVIFVALFHLLVASPSKGQDFAAYDLRPGQIVEGSTRFGGLQPDILLDWVEVKKMTGGMKQTAGVDNLRDISQIVKSVRENYLKTSHLESKELLDINRRYSTSGVPIPLSEYLKIRSGDCRIHGLLTHFLLKERNIPNLYVYLLLEKTNGAGISMIEDHAINLVDIDNVLVIVDSKTDRLNGFPLKKALEQGIGPLAKPLKFGNGSCNYSRVLKIHNFPRVETLKGALPLSNSLMASIQAAAKSLLPSSGRIMREVNRSGLKGLPLVTALLVLVDPTSREEWVDGVLGFSRGVYEVSRLPFKQNNSPFTATAK